jgi:hypothetical protein
MATVSFILLYDSKEREAVEMGKLPLGITLIDLYQNQELYQRFRNKGLKLESIPAIIISYQDQIKEYPWNKSNLKWVSNKIKELMPSKA